MKVSSVFLLLSASLTCTYPGSCNPEEETAEELPQAEPYRQHRPSLNRGNFGGGGGFTDASYDLSKTYDAMITKHANNRMGNDHFNNKFGTNKMDLGFSDTDTETRNDNYDPYAAPSEYGGYASESGYGLSCASGYVNASAVALLAFLFLLNIVQDVVQQVTGGRRRKREEDDSDVFSFISNGGLSALKEGLPDVVLPLMVNLMDAPEASHCLQRPLCEANLQLTTQYGVVGKVVASLLSNVVSKAFSGDDTKRFHQALKASSIGRSTGNCSAMFPSCDASLRKQTSQTFPNHNRDDDRSHHGFQHENDPLYQYQQASLPFSHNHFH